MEIKRIDLETFKFIKLNPKEIKNILGVIEGQMEKSCQDGLVIGEYDLVVEEFLFLCMVNNWGGIKVAERDLGIERAGKSIDDNIESNFKPFQIGNFIKNREKQEENQKRYMAHLEAVKKGIMELFRK